MNWWVDLTKFAWMWHWYIKKSWLGFGDNDLIFKVTAGLTLPNLSQKMLLCTVSHELVGRFQPDLHGYNIGIWWRADYVLVTLTYFSRSLQDLNFQIWAKRCLCAHYLMNQLADFNHICMDITFGHDDLIFKVTTRLNSPNLSQKVFVCMLSHGP